MLTLKSDQQKYEKVVEAARIRSTEMHKIFKESGKEDEIVAKRVSTMKKTGQYDKHSEFMKDVRIKNSVKTRIKTGNAIDKSDLSDFTNYRLRVRQLSEKTYKRNKNKIDPLNLRSRKFHLDHKVSIFEGFKNNIEPSILASIHNLCILTEKDNISKKIKSSITIEELLRSFSNE
jgi:hypothetical protein